MKQDKLIDHLDDRFILLHNLTDDYVSGRITVSQYTVGRDLIGLNYPKAINELYGFALPWWERWLYRIERTAGRPHSGRRCSRCEG